MRGMLLVPHQGILMDSWQQGQEIFELGYCADRRFCSSQHAAGFSFNKLLDRLCCTGAGVRHMVSSTHLRKRMVRMTARKDHRLGAWSAVMGDHHKGHGTTSDGPSWPPNGSLFRPSGGRQQRLPMALHELLSKVGDADFRRRVRSAFLRP